MLPSSGTVALLGHDVAAGADRVKRMSGIVFGGERGLHGCLSTRQSPTYWARIARSSATSLVV
ncbi:hypothetical protein ACFW4K_01500 [Nocardiopsis alba]|uniref:hypothetical protein n=1 Tax=Nocardiopsis alba TaxID=53437 RepID=UPI00366F6A42